MGKLADSIRVMSYDHEDLERLSTFLRKIDGIFPIPLSKKVNIDEYALKTLSKGVALCAEDSGKIVGILLGYANDSATKNAYIGTLGVLEEYRSRGIGKSLVNYMKELSRSYGMERICLFTHKSNEPAIRFYINNGFTITPPPSTERPDEVYLVAHLE
jgi:ribosomal protein S18 acetylase RimI-like enzyme